MRTRSETVSFRADPDLLKLIDSECVRFGISRGNLVRGVVVSHIHQLDLKSLDERFDVLTQSLDSLSSDLAKSLFYILTRVGEMSADQAREFVREKLSRKDG